MYFTCGLYFIYATDVFATGFPCCRKAYFKPGFLRVLLYLFFILQVAKKYNLYTKVTGGQRIDMFGAEKHQVWAANEKNERKPAV